jgi:hypothetical protein
MAKTIPQLTDATTVNAADELIIQQGGITKRATGAELAKGLNTINGTVNVKDFGAVGNGTTNDAAAFEAAADQSSLIEVNSGNYNLGTNKFTKFVAGTGSVSITGSAGSAAASGFFVGHDVAGGSIVSAPNIWSRTGNSLTAPPGDVSSYFNVIMAPDCNVNQTGNQAWRSVIVGASAGANVNTWERVEAIGEGCMRFARLAERITAVGSIAYQWLGAPNEQYLRDTFHDFWRDQDVADPAWDYFGLAGRNADIRAAINSFTDYPTARSQCSTSVAIARDAGLHAVRDVDSVYVGYQAGTHCFSTEFNVAIGSRALRDSVFAHSNTAIGRSAGLWLQQGSLNVFLGRQSGSNLVKGSRNVLIGPYAGSALGDTFDDKFVVQNNTGVTPLLLGDFASRQLTIDGDLYLQATAGDNNGRTLEFRNTDTTINPDQVYGTLAFYGNDNQSPDSVRGFIRGISTGTAGAMAIEFATQLGDVTTTPPVHMRLTSAGSLGVGTTAPSSKLHVAGDLTVSSATTATTATAGAETLPANPVGFLVVSINGTSRKIPYYAT